jgi:hypothetical protein
VVKAGFDRDLATFLVHDLKGVVDYLSQMKEPMPPQPGEAFHH